MQLPRGRNLWLPCGCTKQSFSLSLGERQAGRDRKRNTERDRDRKRCRKTDRNRHRERQTD